MEILAGHDDAQRELLRFILHRHTPPSGSDHTMQIKRNIFLTVRLADPALLECFPPALVSEQSGHYRPDVTQEESPIDILLECDGTNEEDQEQV